MRTPEALPRKRRDPSRYFYSHLMVERGPPETPSRKQGEPGSPVASLFVFLAALFASCAGADPILTDEPGRNAGAVSPPSPEASAAEKRELKLDYSVAPVGLHIVLPPPSAAEKRAAAAKGGKRRTVIGFHRAMPGAFSGDLAPQLDWLPQPDGSFASALSVTSPEAESVRVGIRAELGAGGEIRFFGEQSDERFAAFTWRDFHVEGGELQVLWSPAVEGDTIGIEISLPSGKARSAFSLRVDALAHTFRSMSTLHRAPKLECPDLHIDVQCRTGSIHGRLQDAVARIRFEHDGNSYVCSGTLLNDKVSDSFIPYFLTAQHCVSTGSVARSVEAWWFYQRASCGGSARDRRFARSTGGTDLLTASPLYDLSLLRFRGQLPGELAYSGWSGFAIDHPADVYGIHHPDGDFKKYSGGTTGSNRDSLGLTNAVPVTWSEGTTEGGSSGSGLFLRNGGHLVGGLSHGPDCDYGITDHYGPFRDFLPQASRWLDAAMPPPADDDHGDILAAASVVPLPSSTGGNLERGGDRDWFRIDLDAADSLRVLTRGPTDTYGTLTLAGHDLRHEDDDSGADENFQLLVIGPEPGVWYVEVRGVDSNTTGVYTLHVEGHGPPDHVLPLVLAASHSEQRSFVRIANRSGRSGSVSILAIDDSGRPFGPISLALDAGETASFNSRHLERGGPSRGLSDGVGTGSGDWRLELRTGLEIEARAYVRGDGFVTAMHAMAEETDLPQIYHVPFFNPASNRSIVSWLRLINPGDEAAEVLITGVDKRGDPPPGGGVRLSLPARAARMLSARQLERGGYALSGRLGDGAGKWDLYVAGDRPLQVMSLVRTRSGYLGNLSR